MKTVTLSIANQQAVKQRALDALSGKRRGAHISFASADLLWKVLTAKRWELLKAMATAMCTPCSLPACSGRPWTGRSNFRSMPCMWTLCSKRRNA